MSLFLQSKKAQRFKGSKAQSFVPLCLCASVPVIFLFAGCASDRINLEEMPSYQLSRAEKWPSYRTNSQELEISDLKSQVSNFPKLEMSTDPNTGEKTVTLTIEQVLARTLANSSEITVIAFDPMISRQEITKAESQFDLNAFGQVNLEKQDNPSNSIYQAGQSEGRTLESGIKQKNTFGSEWSLSYAMTRNWDDLSGRTLSTRYEPIMSFQFRQPLLKDAWEQLNLAGVETAEINYDYAMAGFRGKAEETAVLVISSYWQLYQARRVRDIHQELLDNTIETLTKVEGRREIDATDMHIKQVESYVKSRQATLLTANKNISDAQDQIVRLMSEPQLGLFDEFSIIPDSVPMQVLDEPEISKLLATAVENNPILQQAKLDIEISDINVRVAKNQELPRLDLVTSARTQGLDDSEEDAQDSFNSGDYISYGVGLSLEYPLGNRQGEAEILKRRIERRKAITTLQNLTERLTVVIKEGVRSIETNYAEIGIQSEAIEAAATHLQAVEDAEQIREELTPEFLLVKLQAQETLANAQIAHLTAITQYNIALAELAKTTGTVLRMQQVENSLPDIK
jgi:outer membrane protein